MLRADRNISVEDQVLGIQALGNMGEQDFAPVPVEQEQKTVRYPKVGVFHKLVNGTESDIDEKTRQAYELVGVMPPRPKVPMYYLTIRGGVLVEKTPDGDFIQHKEYVGQVIASERLFKLWDENTRRFVKLERKPKTDAELHRLLVERYGFTPEDAQRLSLKNVSFYREVGLFVPTDGEEKKCILTLAASSSARFEEYVRRLLGKGVLYTEVLTKITGEMYFDPVKNNTYPVVNFEALDLDTGEPVGVDTYDMSQQPQGNKGAKGKKKQ